tara:strand:+ start:76116 stop:77102 length:987 start_codon:yes stop_codon:yes gene_type:complete
MIKFMLVAASLLATHVVFAQQDSTLKEDLQSVKSTPSRWSSFYQHQFRVLKNEDASLTSDMVPKTLNLRTHLMAVQYRIENDWNFEAGIQYLDMDINLLGNNLDINAGSRGLSDLEVGMVKEIKEDTIKSKFRIAMSLPTGSIRQKDSATVNMGPGGPQKVERILPYQGQLGSGTYDLQLEYDQSNYFLPMVYWRNKFKLEKRNGRNDLGYRLGDEAKIISEVNFPIISKYVTGMVGGTYKTWSQVVGPNPVLEEVKANMPFPIELEDLYAKPGERFETYYALKTGMPIGTVGFASLELGRPIQSNVTGNSTELKTDWYGYLNIAAEL